MNGGSNSRVDVAHGAELQQERSSDTSPCSRSSIRGDSVILLGWLVALELRGVGRSGGVHLFTEVVKNQLEAVVGRRKGRDDSFDLKC